MELYKEKYFNRRNWILTNISFLNINSNEAIILLLIDLFNEYNETITTQKLSDASLLSNSEVDSIINKLYRNNYLSLEVKEGNVSFDISNIFKVTSISTSDNDIFELFEDAFAKPLSQKEMTTISEWCRVYDKHDIKDALKKAVIADKVSLQYIDRILIKNNDK